MSKDLFKIIAIGRLTKDSRVFRTESRSGISFSIAVNGFKDEDTVYCNCFWYHKDPDKMLQYLTKGKQVCVDGEPSVDSYNGKPYMKINVSNLQMFGSSLTPIEAHTEFERMENVNRVAIAHGNKPIFDEYDKQNASKKEDFYDEIVNGFNGKPVDDDRFSDIPF